ncbi:nicotinate-nicotinamide nucleotide adenylyltransferase [Ruegeria marisrubri]|uniref:Probable nicotinate-nucleotide adenylyltransferase n=1 Tax=Ruegeria marisrubri TaxID=1685379 RepID=A0A0X3TKM2_9RHOB|nr:nicotinate-nucleotide adenylyltransferase [Ruegeria marisrubri]KUJ76315.1 nicotinate-nicotinamide nucleotide adenylyltransferase [Ruegeria marisrubri]
MRHSIPFARPGQVVGLLGGSFDPPHEGHVHVTLEAMKAFGLDRVWWLVSPGNPLKRRCPAPLERRMRAARAMMRHPRVEITDIEAQIGTRATADTLRALRALYPGVRFVWLMGADNLAQLHQWQNWREIMENCPVGVVARPGDRISARMSPAARAYGRFRLDGEARHLLGRSAAPAWCFVNVPMVNVSSTEIRTRGEWGQSHADEKSHRH